MDTKLLLKLFHLPSPSYQEGPTREFIENFLRERNISYTRDSAGNVFNISKPGLPLLSAHMDTVQTPGDVLMAKFTKVRGGIVKGYGCIGADDKNGIYVILHLLDIGWAKRINFVFSVEEEVGGYGADEFVKSNNISKLPYALILDRRDSGDIICSNNDYGTQEFENELFRLGRDFGYKPTWGSISDADKISDYISCANLSVGYYNAHSRHEYVVLDELENTVDYVKYIIDNIQGEFGKPDKSFNYGNSYYQQYGMDDLDYYNGYGYGNTKGADSGMLYTKCESCYGMASKGNLKFINTLNMNICNTCYHRLLEEMMDDYEDFFLESIIKAQ